MEDYTDDMTARDVVSALRQTPPPGALPEVEASLPLVDVLHRLLEAPGRELAVTEGTEVLGVADQTSVLEGLGRMLVARDDSSLVTVECGAGDYSASRLAHAVEDADAHLVDLWSAPARHGRVAVTMRVRRSDPTPVCHSLERYGFEVVASHGGHGIDAEVSAERLLALQMILNV